MLPVQSRSKGSDDEIRCWLRGGGVKEGLGMGSLQPCPQLCNDAGCRSTSRAPLCATQQPGEFLRQTHPRRLVQTAVMLHAYSIYLHRAMWMHMPARLRACPR